MEEEAYQRFKTEFLSDQTICKENRQLYKEFFDFTEYKLKRRNNLRKLDGACYKTLYGYISLLKNVNMWFHNKPLAQLTKDDIKRVYDGLEDGTLVNKRGLPFKDRRSYYNKVFKSKLFKMVGKADISREVMEFTKRDYDSEVRFIREEDFRQLVEVMVSPQHKALGWLAFDVGENVNALLQLRKSDFVRRLNPDSKEPEYLVNLRNETLKRSRRSRTELTNYKETVSFLDIIMKDLHDNDILFDFQYRMSKKVLDRAVSITKIKCTPKGQKVTWKDLRSSMACNLLIKGWSIDEINARLGHTPSSREIDKYVNFLAIDRTKPKKKIHEGNISAMQEELDKTKDREKLQARRLDEMREKMENMEKMLFKSLANMKPADAARQLTPDLAVKLQKLLEY
jgi:hypothetical protein